MRIRLIVEDEGGLTDELVSVARRVDAYAVVSDDRTGLDLVCGDPTPVAEWLRLLAGPPAAPRVDDDGGRFQVQVWTPPTEAQIRAGVEEAARLSAGPPV